MDAWLEHEVKDVIWKGIVDGVGKLEDVGEPAVRDYLRGLSPGQKISGSPLVAAVAKAPDSSNVTLLVRGRFPLFSGAISPFIRLQIVLSTAVDLHFHDFPIQILDWQTVVGDLQIKKEAVFTAELGFGYDKGTWLGRGALKILPAGFGLDILLGGLDERGLMIGIDLDLPAPIPLGNSGVVLSGVGGDFAYNFVPRLNQGVPKNPPAPFDAHDYVDWAKDKQLDRWQPGPPDKTAVGIGLSADFGDLPTMGFAMSLDPIGLAVLTPGPIFVLGGKGKLLKSDSIEAEGYVAVDIASESMALGLGVKIEVPRVGPIKLVKASGTLDAFFSWADTSLWYVRLGTNTSPIKAQVMQLLDADAFLMLGHAALPPLTDGGAPRDGIFFGVGLSFGRKWEWSIIYFTARIGARLAAGLGWNPIELQAAASIYGELGLKVWKFGFLLRLELDAIAYVPKPAELTGIASYHLELPWPIPDINGHTEISIASEPGAPDLKSPLLAGPTHV